MPNGTWCLPPRHGRPRPLVDARAGGHHETMLFDIVLALTIGCIAFILNRRWLGARGWGLLLLPVAMAAAGMAGGAKGLIPAELTLAVLAVVFAPKLAARLVPFGVLGLAVFGFSLAGKYGDGFTNPVHYLFVHAAPGAGARTALIEAAVLFVVGLWLLLRLDPELVGSLAARWLDRRRRGISVAHALLLIPVAGLAMLLLGPGNWFGFQAVDGLDAALIDLTVAAAGLVLIFRSRAWAATLAAAGLLVLGAYGWLIAVFWPAVPGFAYGFSDLHNNAVPAPLWSDALQGSVLLALGLWLAPRVMRGQLADSADLELAARARQLTRRVQLLTQTRYDAVDTAAAELRRIERDLHDGAQARLVALGMSLQAAERLFPTSPEAALALVAEAKQSSSLALTELRDLVRGIYPPVLADRGLADAIRALALDAPLPVDLDIDLSGQVELPVASAVYFSVAEVLANVVKHAHARSVRIHLSQTSHLLRAQVTDDGAGGADPAAGTGLAGVERRLETFDGILAVSSPPGGPTIVVIGEDLFLLREGLVKLLSAHGFEIVAAVATAPELLAALVDEHPDVGIVDVRLPPTHTDDGLRAALRARQQIPGLPVLVLSQYVEQLYARELLADQAGGVGYLLKDRVFNDEAFTAAIRTVAAGGTVLDPEVVGKLMTRRARDEPVARLTPREHEVLALMAEGRSNVAIAQRLFITEKAVSKHAAGIFAKLDLALSDDDNRRVLAVLAYLDS